MIQEQMKTAMADVLSAGARARRALPLVCILSATVALASAWPANARASEAHWRFEPALSPPPPSGVKPAPDAVPLGGVGEISFWAPNRGLLISGGSEAVGGVVPAGLYAYDGVSWHQLSSVCGGAKGRIAWAGPDEFWTIADQRAGQITSSEVHQGSLEALSLCHFVGDAVVGSYAMPLGEPGSYLEMDAAGCLSPTDCWFAGQDGQPPNQGSFHLHWNGSEVSTYYDSSDHAVTGIASFNGRLYEGLSIGAGDAWLPGEEPAHPPVIRTVAPAGQTPLCSTTGEQSSFCNLFLFSEGSELPVYPEHTPASSLGGFDLATDGGPLGAGATQLWADAGPLAGATLGPGQSRVTVLRDAQGSWTQLLPPSSGSSPLPAEATLAGSSSDVSSTRRDEPGAGSIAPVPGSESAWLSLNEGREAATVALLKADGSLAVTDELPEAGEDVGFRGSAGPIACPAFEDCWMATDAYGQASGGWLFHLSNGASPPPNTDPLFDGADGVIAYRPPDSGLPAVYPNGFAEDDSLANQQPPPAPTGTPKQVPAKPAKRRRGRPLVTHVSSKFLHHRTLVLSFTLTAKARVQLIARDRRQVVAKTRRRALRPGRHSLSLSFELARWPTKVEFHIAPAVKPSAGGSQESESNETIAT
jgi:hypothetical protein